MNAADVMTRTVLTVRETYSIVGAIRLMLEHRISGLPVVDGAGRVVGMLTEGDLLRRIETGTERHRAGWLKFLVGPGQLAEDYVQSHGRQVGEIMSRDVDSVAETATLAEVVDLMERRHIRRVPVITDGRLAGIISRADLLKTLAKALERLPARLASDEALRELVTGELARLELGRAPVSVRVTGAVVTLEGTVFDLRERDAIRVAAENVAGVRRVDDQLYYADPMLVGLMGA